MFVTDARDTASVSWIEHQTLEHIKGALRVTVEWRAPAVSLGRKKSSVRFTLQSFRRHLERLMQIEEADGYLEEVIEAKPYLQTKIQRLAAEHSRFRDRLRELEPRLDGIADWQDEEFDDVCRDILDFLTAVDRHDAEEVRLIQETQILDEGGEG